jgi:hypothetical protein
MTARPPVATARAIVLLAAPWRTMRAASGGMVFGWRTEAGDMSHKRTDAVMISMVVPMCSGSGRMRARKNRVHETAWRYIQVVGAR